MGKILILEDLEIDQKIYQRILGRDHDLVFLPSLEGLDKLLKNFSPDLAILDLFLEKGDGFQALEVIVENHFRKDVPIFFVSACVESDVRIKALTLGALDFVTKPIHPTEFRLKVENTMGRSRRAAAGAPFCLGTVCVDMERLEAVVKMPQGNRTVGLTVYEARLMKLFLVNAGKILSRSSILTAVWGESIHVSDRAVDNQVSVLRRKCDGLGLAFESVYGVGYRLSLDPLAA